MTLTAFRSLAVVLVSNVLLACGGGTKTAESETTASSKAAAAEAASGSPTAPAPASSQAAPAAPADDASSAPKRTVGDYVFSPTMAFMLNDSASALREASQKECEKKFPGNLSGQAACREKARNKFVADVLVFEKKPEGIFFTIYKRSGSTLAETCKSKVTVAEDGAEKLHLKIVSEKGYRTLFAGKKDIVVGAASDSSIQIDEPMYGKLVYEARIGLLSQQGK